MPEVVLPPYLQSVLALRPPLATSTRTDLAPSFKLLHSTVNVLYGVSGIHGLEPGLWRAQLIRITLRSAQLIEAVWTKLGGQGGVIIDDQCQGGRGVMKLQSVFSDLQMFIASLATLQDPLSAILLDPAAFRRTQSTVTSLSKKILALIQHYEVADILPTPIDQWPEEDSDDKEEDHAALPVLIAKSRPSKAVLLTFQDKYVQRDQAEPSSSTTAEKSDQDAQVTSNALSSSTSSATPSLPSSSFANSGLSTANRSDFLRFVYSQNPNLIGNEDLDSAVAAGTATLSSMTFSSKVSAKSLSNGQAGYKPRKSLVQQRISSFASSADALPPLPSSTLNPYNSPRRVVSDNPTNGATRKSWAVDMSGLNGIQRQVRLSSSKPPSHPAPSTQILGAAPPVSWKSSASRSASINSRSSSIAESLNYSRSSSGEISDLKHKLTPHIQEQTGNINEHGDAPTSGDKDGAPKGPPPPTFAEQAAAIVAARKQRAISTSSSLSRVSKDRYFSPSLDDFSNELPTTRKHSIPNGINFASESPGAAIPPPDVDDGANSTISTSKPNTVPERATSSISENSSGSESVSKSSSTTMDLTVMLAADTTITSLVEPTVSCLSTSPTTNANAGSLRPSTSGSSVTSVLNSDSSQKHWNTSTKGLNPSSSYSSPTSPTSSSAYGPFLEPDANFELVPDLIEHTSLLDVILTPTDVSINDSATKSPKAVEMSQPLSPTKTASSPRSPNRTFEFLESSHSQAKALPAEESSPADLMVQASMFETWTPETPEQEQPALGSGSRSSVSSTVHPKAPNDPKSWMMISQTASSPSLSLPGSIPRSDYSGELKPEMTRSISTTSTSAVSPTLSSTRLRPIDGILTLPEGNHSSAILSLAGSTSSTPSASGNSWATSFISNSPLFPDLDWNFLNGNYTRDQLFIPPPANPLKTGWRILCLDGGGVRGLSMLYVVSELMLSIQAHLQLERTPLPCEIFEMICGVGTGGIIALLLGRLRLDISIAIPAYIQIVSQVFGHSKGVIAAVRRTTRFSASRLEAVIREVVNRISGTPELTLADQINGTSCRTFVISTRTSENKRERGSYIKLRSYPHGSMTADTCSIAQAARATSAAPLFFKPPKLNDEANRYLDSVPTDTTVNNPSFEAITEANSLFPGRPIDCLVSLGVGSGIVPGSGSIARACSEMLESCERTAQEVEAKSIRTGWSEKYFRLAVKGLKNEDNRGEWQNPDSVKAGTASYIFAQEQDNFNKQVDILSNSWKGAYEEDVFKSLKMMDNKMSNTPHSAILPARNPQLSSELLLRRSVSQVEMQVKPPGNHGDKTYSLPRSSPASDSNTGADLKGASTMGFAKISSLDSSSHFQGGVDVKPHLTDPSYSSFLNDLKLPEFDFSKA